MLDLINFLSEIQTVGVHLENFSVDNLKSQLTIGSSNPQVFYSIKLDLIKLRFK